MSEVWTDRTVKFSPDQTVTREKWEAFFDDIPEHYWSRPTWMRRLLEPGISACNQVVSVSNLPWWMPGWWARRTLANMAAKHGITGDATYVVTRAVLA